MTIVTRHYVVVDGRLVHYRRAGQGPLLLLLHQSPQSSLDFVDLMLRWSDRFTMLAPDRPGCGQSDPLPDRAPHFDQYGDAVAALLEVLGIARVAIYGFHTGAREALSDMVQPLLSAPMDGVPGRSEPPVMVKPVRTAAVVSPFSKVTVVPSPSAWMIV